MTTVNIHEAKTNLSRLVDRVARGETITIARAGRPVALLTPLAVIPAGQRRLGFLRSGYEAPGASQVPDDFDRVAEDEIADLFEDGE
jgi:prevent-host-death family protein